jgi:hypothetical protein
VIAIDAGGEFTGEDDFVSALYGMAAVRYYENGWAGRRGWRQTQVSAVLASTMIAPWTVGAAVPTLWHHPGADLPAGEICPPFRQARLDLTSRQIQYGTPKVGPEEFFGLPRGWPERGD